MEIKGLDVVGINSYFLQLILIKYCEIMAQSIVEPCDVWSEGNENVKQG